MHNGGGEGDSSEGTEAWTCTATHVLAASERLVLIFFGGVGCEGWLVGCFTQRCVSATCPARWAPCHAACIRAEHDRQCARGACKHLFGWLQYKLTESSAFSFLSRIQYLVVFSIDEMRPFRPTSARRARGVCEWDCLHGRRAAHGEHR
jgi:hypothetical protein